MRSSAFFALALLVSAATASASVARAESSVLARRGDAGWLFRARSRTTTGDPEALARSAIASAAPSVARLALASTTTHRFGDGDAIVRFEQTHRGLPVIGRGASARLFARGEAPMIAVDLEEDLPASTTPRVGPSDAATAAARFSIVGATADDAHLVVWPLRGGGSRLAWAVLPRVPTGMPIAPRVIVDAETGKILDARDLVRFAKANVYRFNPIATPALVQDDLALAPAGGKLTSDFVRSLNCVDNKTVRQVSFGGSKTPVHVCDLVQTATADGNGDFLYQPADVAGSVESKADAFSEVQMYYHASKAYAFFRGLQGSSDAQVVHDKPLPVIANLQLPAGMMSGNFALAADPNRPLETFSNAFFSPAAGGLGGVFAQLYSVGSGALWFGQGAARDYAYDGDVVYHELTHAVVDDTLQLEQWHVDERGAVDSPGAMNEALADYFAAAISEDPNVGEYASRDFGYGGGAIRTLANSDKCPSNVIGEVHADSTLFSGALWQARSSLAGGDRPKFDAALYKAMRLNPGRGDLGFEDLAKLFEVTLTTDLPAGAAALQKAMTDRGVFPSCDRIFEAQGSTIKAVDGSLGGFTAPGTQSVQLVSDVVPGMLQVHVPFGSRAPAQLAVSFVARRSRMGGGYGGGTPFTPTVLTKFGQPITWTISAGNQGKHDADLVVDPDGTSGTVTATIDVPEGATDAYLQIANKGDEDGAYDDIDVSLVPPASKKTPAAAAPDEPPPAVADESGCAVQSAGRGAPLSTGALTLGIAVFLGAARRRRR